MTIKIQDDYALVDIYVQPGAKQTQVCGIHDTRLKIKISAPPVDGKANQEVLDFFAKKLKISKREISLVSGEKSRNKRIKICQLNSEQIDFLRKLYL